MSWHWRLLFLFVYRGDGYWHRLVLWFSCRACHRGWSNPIVCCRGWSSCLSWGIRVGTVPVVLSSDPEISSPAEGAEECWTGLKRHGPGPSTVQWFVYFCNSQGDRILFPNILLVLHSSALVQGWSSTTLELPAVLDACSYYPTYPATHNYTALGQISEWYS